MKILQTILALAAVVILAIGCASYHGSKTATAAADYYWSGISILEPEVVEKMRAVTNLSATASQLRKRVRDVMGSNAVASVDVTLQRNERDEEYVRELETILEILERRETSLYEEIRLLQQSHGF